MYQIINVVKGVNYYKNVSTLSKEIAEMGPKFQKNKFPQRYCLVDFKGVKYAKQIKDHKMGINKMAKTPAIHRPDLVKAYNLKYKEEHNVEDKNVCTG